MKFYGEYKDVPLKNNKKWIVYLIRHKESNRLYCGKTSIDRYRLRMSEHKSVSLKGKIKSHIHNAISHYGINKFDFTIIESFETENEALLFEIQYIRNYELTKKNKGFNLTNGGDGVSIDAESLEDICKGTPREFKSVVVYRTNGEFLKEFRSRKEASRILNVGIANINGILNKRTSNKSCNGYCFFNKDEEIPSEWFEQDFGRGSNKLKVSKAITGMNIETLEVTVFSSRNEASEKTSTATGSISKCCKGNAKSAGGYVWSYLNESNKLMEKIYQVDIGVIGISLNNDEIIEFRSAKEAQSELNIFASSIRRCADKKVGHKSAGGYTWRYRRDIRREQGLIG